MVARSAGEDESQSAIEALQAYSSVAVVGLGLVGGSLALAIRRSGYSGRVLGVSRAETLALAREQRIVDAGFEYDRLTEAASAVELLILATPIHRISEHLTELGRHGDRLRPGLVITDVGSTKGALLSQAEQCLPESVVFVGGHPMAGSEKSGLAAADPFLFQNAIYALTPGAGAPPGEVERLAGFLGKTGARMVILAADVHDRIAAAISHLPQLLAVALVNYLEELGDDRDRAIQLAAGGFRDMTRIASSPFDIWRDIFATNTEEVRSMAKHLARHLERTAELTGTEELGELFESAATTRAAIPRDTKGFLRRLWELLVVVEDQPGTIARIATLLADEGINIKDIEVLKVREGEGGTLRLAFSSRAQAAAALRQLEAAGFTARARE